MRMSTIIAGRILYLMKLAAQSNSAHYAVLCNVFGAATRCCGAAQEYIGIFKQLVSVQQLTDVPLYPGTNFLRSVCISSSNLGRSWPLLGFRI